MRPAGTGGLAKVKAYACAPKRAVGPTVTPGTGEIIQFFEGESYSAGFRQPSFYLLKPPSNYCEDDSIASGCTDDSCAKPIPQRACVYDGAPLHE